MPSKKVTISQKIFIFLLVTVGIVFILLQVYRSVREGFQTNTDDIKCELVKLGNVKDPVTGEVMGDKETYICDTRDDAISQINAMKGPSFNNIGVCYTDIRYDDTTQTYSNANFFAAASNVSTTFYTCFQRPVPEVFDINAGVKFPIEELEDTQPAAGTASVQTNCSAYNGTFQTYFTSYIKTSSILGSINTIGYSNIASSINVLSTVSTQKCVSANDTISNTSNIRGVNNTAEGVCNSISTGISYFRAMSNDTGPESLKTLTGVIGESKNMLSNQVYNILKPAFLNSGCVADADITKYMEII